MLIWSLEQILLIKERSLLSLNFIKKYSGQNYLLLL